jgi:ADP-heptose:LPS heptosyltransferase
MTAPIILFKVNYLGDAMSFLPTVAGVRRVRPDAPLTIVCSSVTAPLYRATFPDIGIIPLDRSRVNGVQSLRHLPGLAARLASLRPGHALLSHDEPSLCLLAARASGAPARVGFDMINHRLHWTFTKILPARAGRTIYDLNFDLVRMLAGRSDLQPERTPVGTQRADHQTADARLSAVGLEPGQPFVLIHPFAKFAFRRWPLERFADLAARLDDWGIVPVVVAAEPIADLGPARAVHGLSLSELAALSARARLFIGNNSGPMHIAASMGTPTLVLQGPSPAEWTLPWTPASNHRLASVDGLACQPCDKMGAAAERCTNAATPNACLDRLRIDQVFAQAIAMLEDPCTTP